MHAGYVDITSKLGAPLWWDEFAVPRYDPFTPDLLANIYWREAVLMVIGCQSCSWRGRVAMSWGSLDIYQGRVSLRERMSGAEVLGLHYGDPPVHGCSGSGETMNCLDFRVLEFWRRETFDRARVTELEVVLEDAGGDL